MKSVSFLDERNGKSREYLTCVDVFGEKKLELNDETSLMLVALIKR